MINDKARLAITQPSYFGSFELFFFLFFFSILFPLNFRYRYPMRLLRKLSLFMVSYIKHFPWLYIFKFQKKEEEIWYEEHCTLAIYFLHIKITYFNILIFYLLGHINSNNNLNVKAYIISQKVFLVFLLSTA